jgi:hypothetical protein
MSEVFKRMGTDHQVKGLLRKRQGTDIALVQVGRDPLTFQHTTGFLKHCWNQIHSIKLQWSPPGAGQCHAEGGSADARIEYPYPTGAMGQPAIGLETGEEGSIRVRVAEVLEPALPGASRVSIHRDELRCAGWDALN